MASIVLVHTYNTQEASWEAINAAFSREVDSLVSLCRYLYILSKVCLLLVFLSFLSMPLGFTRQTLGATYVRLLLAGDHSPLPIPLPSAVSGFFSGISSVSLYISTATKHVRLLHRTRVTGRGFIRIIYSRGPIPRHFTNIHTYICPDFDSTLHDH